MGEWVDVELERGVGRDSVDAFTAWSSDPRSGWGWGWWAVGISSSALGLFDLEGLGSIKPTAREGVCLPHSHQIGAWEGWMRSLHL